MSEWFELWIGYTRSAQRPVPGETSLREIRGGPESLLGWLEDQLALKPGTVRPTDRVLRYMQALGAETGPSFRESFEVDPWPTAADLLDRRDELLMGGWDGTARDDFPDLVNDLATVESKAEIPSGTPDRLSAVIAALEDDQTLPEHRCHLHEPIEEWPKRWRPLLERLETDVAASPSSAADEPSTLRAVQELLQETPRENPRLEPDDSFGLMATHSTHRAARAVAAFMEKHPGCWRETVIVCPDPETRSVLDRTFHHADLPNLGVSRPQHDRPALQVLPLVLEMLWEPVDPRTLMDFLSLPVSPLPRDVTNRLARGLSEMPGLGSEAWEHEVQRSLEASEKPDELEHKLSDWFEHERRALGEPVTSTMIEERCRRVAQWGRGYAEGLREDGDTDDPLADSLEAAAAVAAAVRTIVLEQDRPLEKPQLDRIVEDVQQLAGHQKSHEETAEGPRVVEALKDVPRSCEHLIWLGLRTEEPSGRRWTTAQRKALEAAGIEVESGDRERRLRRDEERRGLLGVSGSVTAVSFLQDVEEPAHPLWLLLEHALADHEDPDDLPTIDDCLESGTGPGPWDLDSREVQTEGPQPRRSLFDLPDDLLMEPDTRSASELQERLGCPAKWVFNRAADLQSSPAASLPRLFRLKGRFSHRIFETVFGDGEDLPEPAEARQRVEACFDERVDRDAAPLMRPGNLSDKQALRSQLGRSAETFVELLQRGSYEIVGIEVTIEAEHGDRPLGGKIDAVLRGESGNEAVVDFKYAGSSKYPDLLRDGRAVQLAVYCEARRQQLKSPDRLEGTGYLVFRPSRLFTPEGRTLRGARDADIVGDAPDIFDVWHAFAEALDRSEGWLHEGEPVPARPLQDEADWPEGADLVIDTDGSDPRSDLKPCQYCDYDILCGLRTCE